ncbi:MAG: putative DNA binding domain-containing protein [Treponema sp.]|nr:putative DNA binding domain-containing protein [Treponema sp.]
MSTILPINIDDLLYLRGVESARVEFKAAWDEKTTAPQTLKTICGFANDLQNLNGGYIIIGVEEKDGAALMPPRGIDKTKVDAIQRWIRGNCNRIEPEYMPILSPELVEGKTILAIWVPASDIRPHKAPDGDKGGKKYFVRIGSETVDAEKNHVLEQLLQLTAKVPFDDRRAQNAQLEDMRESKTREFLKDIGSGLLQENSVKELYRKMRISVPVNGHDVPKNIGLLMFSANPENWFPCARIEVVQFRDGPGGDVVEEKYFRGGIHEQLIYALTYIESLSESYTEKQDRSFRAKDWVTYPVQALREALVNAVYHRGYEAGEPVKVYIYPDRMEIISYPGPLPGIQEEHLRLEKPMPPLPARNRRIGEFLKELKLAEGRSTGLPKLYRAMADNGSAPPLFDFDEDRSYFRLTLPAHPRQCPPPTLSG